MVWEKVQNVLKPVNNFVFEGEKPCKRSVKYMFTWWATVQFIILFALFAFNIHRNCIRMNHSQMQMISLKAKSLPWNNTIWVLVFTVSESN